MAEKIDLTEVKTEDLIAELEERNELPESDINDFTTAELRAELGIDDDDDIEWNRLYNLFHTNNECDAIAEIKSIIQQKTGRILV